MPADSDPNKVNNPVGSGNLNQVSSSDSPPLPPDVNPVVDTSTPRPGKETDEPEPYTPSTFAAPQPNMPPQSQVTPPPVGSPSPDNQPPTTLDVSNEPIQAGNSTPPPVVTPGGGTMAPVKGSSGLPKKALLIVGGLLLLLGLAFVVIRFVLPMLNGGQGDGTGNAPINQTEIVWWGLWEDQQIVAPVINEYQQNNPGIKITYVPQSKENYRERLTSAFARGEGPDIFRYHNTWVPMFREELATIPNDVMSQNEFSQTFYPVMTRGLLTNDGIVGIPLEIDGLALFINDEIFTTFGKTPPTTWNEFEELARELTVVDDNGLISQAGAAIGNAENVDHWPEILGLIMLQNGVNLNDFDSIAGEGAAQALQFYTDFVTESEVWDETLPTSTIAFSSGKAAMYFGPSWRVFEIALQNPELEFRVVPVPQIPREDTNIPDITYASYWVEGVSDKSDHKNESWEFLKYLSSREALQTFYESASQVRMFGEPYSRQDMRDTLLSAPKVGAFVELAPTAQTWFLASRTWDGETGINTRINKYFEDAVNGMVGERTGGDPEQLMQAVAAGVQEVFVQYGLAAPPPVTSEE